MIEWQSQTVWWLSPATCWNLDRLNCSLSQSLQLRCKIESTRRLIEWGRTKTRLEWSALERGKTKTTLEWCTMETLLSIFLGCILTQLSSQRSCNKSFLFAIKEVRVSRSTMWSVQRHSCAWEVSSRSGEPREETRSVTTAKCSEVQALGVVQ